MKEEIKKFFRGDAEDSEETLLKYSHDASIFDIRPKIVLFPKDAEDVKNLVKWVSENQQKYPGLSITARCAGTDMSGGAVGESIILDFTRHMNKLIRWNESLNFSQVHSITVQPGMFYRDFEKITLSKGMILPCFTASKTINAMGGMFGNNSAGERTLRYGKTEDYILETKVVFADGIERAVKPIPVSEISRQEGVYTKIYGLFKNNEKEIKEAKPDVHKNSAGYYIWNVLKDDVFDLNKLLVGSQGTLGIATEITFRLVPEPKYSRLLVVFLRDMSLLPLLVNKILKYNPQTLESYDDKTFLLVVKYIRGFAQLLGLKNFMKLIFSFLPEAVMTFRNGFPKLALLVEFTGETQKEANEEAEKALQELTTVKKIGLRLTRDALEAKKYWTIRHEAFNLIRYHLKKFKSKPFVDDVIVRPERLPEFFPALYKILNEYKKEMAFAVGGHAGDGNLHIYTLVDPKDPNVKKMIIEVSNKVYDLVVRLGGSITAEHNDGLIRTPYLHKMYSEKMLEIFAEIKRIFDPKHILNPGKKVPVVGGAGTEEYIVKHIAF
ncbi:FAD-binding oxidoreductase [Candidatus Nomurabacteria bacterium]|nr:FAD-binding oxidoreductase [Candidatus Nomurabacteria bacterium]